eukprot:RCo008806
MKHFRTFLWASAHVKTRTPTQTLSPSPTLSDTSTPTPSGTLTNTQTTGSGPSVSSTLPATFAAGLQRFSVWNHAGLFTPPDAVCWVSPGTACGGCANRGEVGLAALSTNVSVALNFTQAGQWDVCYLYSLLGGWTVFRTVSVSPSVKVQYPAAPSPTFACQNLTLGVTGHNLSLTSVLALVAAGKPC